MNIFLFIPISWGPRRHFQLLSPFGCNCLRANGRQTIVLNEVRAREAASSTSLRANGILLGGPRTRLIKKRKWKENKTDGGKEPKKMSNAKKELLFKTHTHTYTHDKTSFLCLHRSYNSLTMNSLLYVFIKDKKHTITVFIYVMSGYAISVVHCF